jgi:hypothetical protein
LHNTKRFLTLFLDQTETNGDTMQVSYHNTTTGQIETGTIRGAFTRGMAKDPVNRQSRHGQRTLRKTAQKAIAGKRLTQSEFHMLSR